MPHPYDRCLTVARCSQNSARVSDLYFLLTNGHKSDLTKTELLMGMYRIGFEGDQDLIFRLFADCDTDQSGIIGIDELYAFMNGRHTNTTRARELTFQRLGDDVDSLYELEWSGTVLRGQLQRLLMHFGFVPLDLLRAWDKSGDGKFTGKEFKVMMKKILGNEKLWDEQVRDVVVQAFQTISGGLATSPLHHFAQSPTYPDTCITLLKHCALIAIALTDSRAAMHAGDKEIDVVEFERWLNKGWLERKAAQSQGSSASKSKMADGHTQASAIAALEVITLAGSTSHPFRRSSDSPLHKALGGTMSHEDLEGLAASTIQQRIRRRQFAKRAQLVLIHEMTEMKAAVKIQSCYRARRARMKAADIRTNALRENAAIALQRRTRVMLAKKQRDQMRAQKSRTPSPPTQLRIASPTLRVGASSSASPPPQICLNVFSSLDSGPAPTPNDSPRVWRPNGRRPSWPLKDGLERREARARHVPGSPGSSLPGSPLSARRRQRSPHRHWKAEELHPTEKRENRKFCELRDVPRIVAEAAHSPRPPPAPEVMYISRKLNWPPGGLKVVDGATNQVWFQPQRGSPRRSTLPQIGASF